MTLLLLLTSHLLVLYVLSKECLKITLKQQKQQCALQFEVAPWLHITKAETQKLQLRDVYCNGHNRRELCEMERDNTKMCLTVSTN